LSQAEDLVRRWLDGATANARDGLRKVASAAVWAGGELHACALFGQPRPLPSLERILSSHPLLHAAEGQLSRDAVAAAAEMEGLRVAHIAPEQAADVAITTAIATSGRTAGPPWAADQRHAAAAAWLALS
jgi:hypothetical protein